MNLIRLTDLAGKYSGQPLAIVGPGPSYDLVPESFWKGFQRVFALNATITKCYTHPGHLWVTNDHDRTFKSEEITSGLAETMKSYSQWRVTSQRKFIPGDFGNRASWISKNGVLMNGCGFRIKPPHKSDIYWYEVVEGKPGYLRVGDSIIEMALEIATIFDFSPIVLIGVDMVMLRGKEIITNPVDRDKNAKYYARPWQWKQTPTTMFRSKMADQRKSFEDNFERWENQKILTLSPYWSGPMERTDIKSFEASS